jgi:hypothetical protein
VFSHVVQLDATYWRKRCSYHRRHFFDAWHSTGPADEFDPPRNNVMTYRDNDIRYDAETLQQLDSDLARDLSAGKQYRQKRTNKPKRRKPPKVSHPGCGISGRRNHYWTW